LPLNLGLMVDTSMSQERIMSAEREASFRFLDRVLRESVDNIFIVQFDAGVFVRLMPTNSRRQLEEALSLVDTPSRAELQIQGGGTRLYDAVVKVSNEIMSTRTNRKALILLTDGVDIGSMATLAEAADAAQRADVLIYSVYFPGEYAFGGGGNGQGALSRLAKETGGDMFSVSKKMSLDSIYESIQEELRSQYSIGYVSDVPVRNPEYRKIRLAARQKGLIVQARDRYWAKH
jgi:VWFA-related protein